MKGTETCFFFASVDSIWVKPMDRGTVGALPYCWSFGFFGDGAGINTGLTVTFCWAGACSGANADFTGALAEVELSEGNCDWRTTAGAGGFATRLGEPGDVAGFTGAMTCLTAPALLAGAVSGINAGFIRDPVTGILAAGC